MYYSTPTLRSLSFALRPCLHASVWLCIAVTASTAAAESIAVDTSIDADAADGFCSLREAILAANTDAAYNECPAGDGTDHIHFSLPLPSAIKLSSDLPAITEDLAIHGPTAGELSLDGNLSFRPIRVEPPTPGVAVAILDLTLKFGLSPFGQSGGGAKVTGGASVLFERVEFLGNSTALSGGGLSIEGSNPPRVTLVECQFALNTAGDGGGLATLDTGAVVSIVRSTFVQNEGLLSGGGLNIARAFVTIEASTISNNAAGGYGGGIHAATDETGPASLHIRDSTITENRASDEFPSGEGGGIVLWQTGASLALTATLENTVLAGNYDPLGDTHPDIFCGSSFAGFNLASEVFLGAHDSCEPFFPTGAPNANGNYVGTVASSLDPGLEPLADNGGPTPTHRPLFSPLSPLIDHGACSGILADQRFHGLPGQQQRIRDLPAVTNGSGSDGCDIGAVEVQGNPMQPNRIFIDGFESGHTLRWSSELP